MILNRRAGGSENGKTRWGGLVFDVADLIKDQLVLRLAFEVGVSGRSPKDGVFRQCDTDVFNPRYLEMLLKTTGYMEHYNKVSTGLHSSRLRFYPHMFMAMEIGYPDKKEQDVIVDYIAKESGKLDRAVNLLEQQITRLKEYKASLINSAVTGKIKVPGVMEAHGKEEALA